MDELDQALKIYGGDVQPQQVWRKRGERAAQLQATLELLLKLLPHGDPVREREA